MSKDLKDMTAEEILAAYNELAEANDKPMAEGFTSLAKGRTAYNKLARSLKPATEGASRGPTQGIGAFAKDMLRAGAVNKDVLAAVQEKFPSAKTTTACIAYYRTALVKAGELTSTRAKAA